MVIHIDGLLSSAYGWNTINWEAAVGIVKRLQARIVKAVQAGDKRKVRGLQRLLRRSFAAQLLAVRRVTSNRGKRTPGVDGILFNTPAKKWQAAQQLNLKGCRSQPLKRLCIPKKNGSKRPLGIPTMHDRCVQALEKLVLEPAAETTADPCSCGFRCKRSAHDAIEACHNALRLKGSPRWILEADIKGCFDHINHQWMLKHIPAHKGRLRNWLKSGYLERNQFHPTEAGTPQGGIISPVLANMALDGMDALLKKHFKKAQKIHMVRYADDFIITGDTKAVLEHEVRPLIAEFLKERGLELSEEKTKITHIDKGFDFLGFTIRKYKGKLLTKPSKSSVASVKGKIKAIITAGKSTRTARLIDLLNPVIRGWGNYFRHSAAKHTFYRIDHAIWEMTWQWARRRHPNKSLYWIKEKYFRHERNRNWVFKEKNGMVALHKMGDIPVTRFIKIRQEANPYDPDWAEYFKDRARKALMRKLKTKRGRLWMRQHGICPMCRTELDNEEGWHIHHLLPKANGGTDTVDNLVLIHAACHRQIHSLYAINQLPDASRRLIRA
ncbi:group II intron reverse transcriptase/maturase [Desulfonema ishimotonii]|uniref:Group II intron reverse transcriptase/maturase n=1 Tax=Desulfonema ishimotonii TaxID=45657 RepID=A0A401FQZ6_9BACT|nr:group II intron reverse transcriptase/maturase [Desulfonema ishimotonii]GBC59383.1 group II intron reverse transcriptase/maturase [Desulfonema ishimotonii]GBC61810.1 group II intron reverse transcriptase/maturase [Desulfonema ishimotonii]